MNVFNHHVIQMQYVLILMVILHVNVNEIILEMDFFVNQLMMKVKIIKRNSREKKIFL